MFSVFPSSVNLDYNKVIYLLIMPTCLMDKIAHGIIFLLSLLRLLQPNIIKLLSERYDQTGVKQLRGGCGLYEMRGFIAVADFWLRRKLGTVFLTNY